MRVRVESHMERDEKRAERGGGGDTALGTHARCYTLHATRYARP
jgi:hypothetical protein